MRQARKDHGNKEIFNDRKGIRVLGA